MGSRAKPIVNEPDLITVEEAALRCRLGKSTIQQWYTSGKIRSVKVGRARRIVFESLRDYIRKLEKQEEK
jgi:excisionase family DNA binding protein